MDKPKKCHLGRHERYEVCLRCDAYRERARAIPGAGAAGAAGANAGGLGM